MIIAALAIYGWELRAILRARKRGTLDWGIRYFLTAVALLIPVSLLSVVLSWPGLPLNPFMGQLENLYGFLGLLGVVSFAIMGMLYKIIPFLVWFGVYSKHIGRAKVPALADMYSSRLQMIGYWSFLAGLVTISVGILRESETRSALWFAAVHHQRRRAAAECRENSGPCRPSTNHAQLVHARRQTKYAHESSHHRSTNKPSSTRCAR